MQLVKIKRVFNCCGQYIITANNITTTNIYCPRCGQKLTNAVKLPTILQYQKN